MEADSIYMMTPEKALRWLIELGSGDVRISRLPAWVDDELTWSGNAKAGWLDRTVDDSGRLYYRLTQKSIDLIKEMKDG